MERLQDLPAEGVNSDGEWVPKRAGRLQLACIPCRASKQKCDRQLPNCKQCERRGRQSTCRYTERGLRSNLASSAKNSSEDKIRRLEAFIQELRGQLAANIQHEPSHDTPITISNEGCHGFSEASAKQETGSLKLLPNGSSQWIAPSYWQSVLCDIIDLKAHFDANNSTAYSNTHSNTNATDGYDSPLSSPCFSTPEYDLQMLVSLLPARANLDTYISTWFNLPEYHKIIVHGPTFQQQYSEMWNDPSTTQPGWYAAMTAIASIGAEILGQTQANPEIQAQAESLRRLAAYSLGRFAAAQPSAYVIEAMTIYALGLLFKYHEVSMYIWQLFGWIVRSCYQQGYHRMPSQNLGMSPFEGEMRCRVWILVQFLESHISSSVGMPSCLVDKFCDTQLPRNLNDHDFDKNTVVFRSRPETDFTLSLTAIYCWKVTRSLREIIDASQQIQTISNSRLVDLNEGLNQARSKLPTPLQLMPLHKCITEPRAQIAGRIKIEILFLRAKCLLYYAFLRRPNPGVQEGLRGQCLSSALRMVLLTIEVLTALISGGWLSDLKILLVRHIHDFKFAAMLLCGELWTSRLTGSSIVIQDLCARLHNYHTIRQHLREACELWNQIEWRSSASSLTLRIIIQFLNDLDQCRQDIDPSTEMPFFNPLFVSPSTEGLADRLVTEHDLFQGSTLTDTGSHVWEFPWMTFDSPELKFHL